MTIEELHASLPEVFRVTPENMPPAIAEAIAFIVHRNALIESGTPLKELPAIEEFRRLRQSPGNGREMS